MELFSELRATVLAEVQRYKNQMMRKRSEKAQRLARFVRARLKELEISNQAFAGALDMDLELADSIIDGLLPSSEIGEDLVSEIALALDYDQQQLQQLLESDEDAP